MRAASQRGGDGLPREWAAEAGVWGWALALALALAVGSCCPLGGGGGGWWRLCERGVGRAGVGRCEAGLGAGPACCLPSPGPHGLCAASSHC